MAKIVRSNLTDQIFNYLKDQIIEGHWKAGEKIPSEIELAKNLGVSRMSLRNAIKKSNLFGLTETRIGEGTFVCKFNMRNYIKELFTSGLLSCDSNKINDLRYLLQFGGIQFALETDTLDSEIIDLRITLNDMKQAAQLNDMEAFHQADMKFHRQICRMSHNDLLYMIYDAIETLVDDLIVENVKKSVEKYGDLSMVLEHHNQLMTGLEKRDFSICEKALKTSRKRSYEFYSSSKDSN